ncbi:hypothetical protein ACOMHN_066251 [Nucella lapillus]
MVKRILWLFIPLPIFWALFNQQQSSELPLHNGQAGYIIMNTMDCKINVRGSPAPFFDGTVAPFAQTEFARVLPGSKNIWVFCPTSGLQTTVSANLSDQKAFRLIVTAQPGQISVIVTDDMRNKVMNGTGYVSYEVALPSVTNATGWEKVGKSFEVGEGGVYTVALIDPATFIDLVNVVVETYKDVKENSVSMALMIPQYLLITIAEILFSISGLAFAYSQKTEYFAYAGLMFVDALIFMVLIRFYKYIDPAKFHKPRKSKKGKKKGHRSKGASGGKHGKGHGKRRSSSK